MVQRLIVFTRYPRPNETKTRLIPALGPEGAAELQRDMTRHVLNNVRGLTALQPVSLEVRFEGGDARRMEALFGSGVQYRPQGTGDLGARLERACNEAFAEGGERTVIIGADCPEITSELLSEAFDRLAASDLVLGPASDGGYYLIGLRRPLPQLFAHMPWGSEEVFNETIRRASELSLVVSLLRMLSDVDRPEDLTVWHRVKGLADPDTLHSPEGHGKRKCDVSTTTGTADLRHHPDAE